MGMILLGTTTYFFLVHWTCKRLAEVGSSLREPS